MTGVPVLTIWWRHCCILPFKTAMILTLQQFSTYYPIPIHGKILSKPIVYASSVVRTSHYSAPYHNRYIIWEKLMSAECAEVSNYPHSEMHHKISDFPSLDNYSAHNFKFTGDMNLVDWCLDMIRTYTNVVFVLIFWIGCHTTINDVSALNLSSV